MKLSKVILIGIIAVTIGVGTIYGQGKYNVNEEKVVTNKSSKIVENGVEVELVEGKIKNGYYTNPEKHGDRAVVLNKDLNGFLIVDSKGNTIDRLEDLNKKMNKIKENNAFKFKYEDLKHTPYFMSGGRLVGDKIYFVTNYDEPGSSLWSMDTKTRNVEKLTDNEKYPEVAFLYAGKDKVLALSQVKDVILEIQNDREIIEHQINGAIINLSPNGQKIAFKSIDSEGYTSNQVSIYDLNSKTSISIKHDDNKFYAHGGVWNESGIHFAYVMRDKNDLDEYRGVMVFNTQTGESVVIEQESKEQKFSTELNSLEFVKDEILEVKTENGNTIQFTINL